MYKNQSLNNLSKTFKNFKFYLQTNNFKKTVYMLHDKFNIATRTSLQAANKIVILVSCHNNFNVPRNKVKTWILIKFNINEKPV